MTDPSSDLQLHPVYSHQLTDGTVIDVAHAYLTSETDPGGVCVTTSKGEISLPADLPVAEGRRLARAINQACDLAEAAGERIGLTVPAEWTQEGTS